MIIPIFWRERTRVKNLPELLDNYRNRGGAIVEYQRLYSIILFTRRFPVYEWVPPETTRQVAGRKHALWCCAFGWWSIFGVIGTGGIILNNLMGGVDVTKILTSPPPIPGQPFDNTALQELQAARHRQAYGFLASLLFLLLVVILIFALPALKRMR
jgi:hypothetical protein